MSISIINNSEILFDQAIEKQNNVNQEELKKMLEQKKEVKNEL